MSTTTKRMQADFTAEEWAAHCEAGLEAAARLGNRGPIRFDDAGRLAQDILDAYRRTGFYVFTGVLDAAEVEELRAEFDEVLDNAPVAKDRDVDQHGRSVKYAGYYQLATEAMFTQGRAEQPPADDSPRSPNVTVGLISHPLLMMDSALRVYGHPKILRMVEGVNGADFIPFHESIFHKGAGEGPPTPWHQDGRTHWAEDGASLEQPDGSGKTHGFNLSVSWSHCTPENCLWVVPGSHRQWRLANGGSFPESCEVLADAVPMTLEPGDCGMVNRSSLHGSYRNHSTERRVTMVLGFHKRESAIGTSTTNVHAFRLPGGKNAKKVTYTEEDVLRRSRMIPLAIDARRQHFPDEEPYVYRGAYLGDAEWNEAARADISKTGGEYWQHDITL
ncbi:MAG: phytanoyl-CoA dioxygenase family protein [Acidimicrobiia bacterium]|nr:phytanoyl-CoA dioxygenase family protein [Acidimicrobiia bacterium]